MEPFGAKLDCSKRGLAYLGTFEKHPHLGGQSPPSGIFLLSPEVIHLSKRK